ncbi:MAG: ImmA/IrrE family metallo-endopeptidase [Dehalococcoidia bacterium]|nr:ImmA/IrrE family metallo-endopeptidase [Dehalococcoidia bacterium]
MFSIDYIAGEAQKLTSQYQTRDPYKICAELGIKLRHKNLGDLKAYYFFHVQIRSIVLNNRISDVLQRILVAHELGHDQLHKDVAMLEGFKETELFDITQPTEYEANLFAAELLIDDDELLELIDDGKDYFSIASELCIPSDFLDFKLRILKHRGYRIKPLYIASGQTFKGETDCFDKAGGTALLDFDNGD